MKKRFEDPADPINVTASVWPAYLYPGEVPGSDYNPEDIGEGLFRGFLEERVSISCSSWHFTSIIHSQALKHIFTSPSSAVHERAKGARSGNAKIHKMKTIEAEHIAYATLLVQHSLLD